MNDSHDKFRTLVKRQSFVKAAGPFLAVIALLVAGDPAWAARNCRLTVTGINFATYIPGQATPVNATGNVHMRCRGNPNAGQSPVYVLSLSAGNSGSFSPRRMQKAPGTTINYNVYTDPLYGTVWGNGSPGTSVIQQTFTTKQYDADHPAYGQVDASQDPEPGYYSDNLVVTLTF